MNPPDEPKGSGAPQAGSASMDSTLPHTASVIDRRGGFSAEENASAEGASGRRRRGRRRRGMLRMSFLEHLQELRSRIIKGLIGCGVAFAASLSSANSSGISSGSRPRRRSPALATQPNLAQIEPMEAFNIIWFKLPLVCAIFLSCPWLLYQVWAFISPGLYRRERRWAVPFILTAAGLFISGGLFAYFVSLSLRLDIPAGLGEETTWSRWCPSRSISTSS